MPSFSGVMYKGLRKGAFFCVAYALFSSCQYAIRLPSLREKPATPLGNSSQLAIFKPPFSNFQPSIFNSRPKRPDPHHSYKSVQFHNFVTVHNNQIAQQADTSLAIAKPARVWFTSTIRP